MAGTDSLALKEGDRFGGGDSGIGGGAMASKVRRDEVEEDCWGVYGDGGREFRSGAMAVVTAG